jgi:hypothetical protein
MIQKIQQVVPTGHAYRERTLGWFMTGISHAKSVHTPKVALRMVGEAKRVSQSRRLTRFLDNGKVRVREWYRPTAEQLLNKAGQAGKIRLIIDATKVAQGHQLLMVALAYRRRALPIAWTWVRSRKGHSSGKKQVALLSYIESLMPEDVTIVLTGDSEFTPLQAQLEEWGWFYVLRQKGSHLYRQSAQEQWRRVDTLVTAPQQRQWLMNIQLTQWHEHSCHFLAYWRTDERVPWLLATNLPSSRQALQEYKIRPWIEEMFGDLKSNGADLEKSCLRHFLRLSRLTLIVALLYVWFVAFGSLVIKRGDRHLVDRADRRDLSIFRIGYDMFLRCLINERHIYFRDVPFFT